MTLLGPVEAWSYDGRVIDIGAPRQRALFAVLCLPAYALAGRGAERSLAFVNTEPLAAQEWYLEQDHAWDHWPVPPHLAPVRVAVIDSGIDASHPEFAGKIDYVADFDRSATDGPAIVDQSGHGTHVAGLACAASGNRIGLAGAGFDCQLLIEKSDLTESSVIAAIIDATDHGAQAINMSFGTSGSAAAPPPPSASRRSPGSPS